MSTPKVAVLGGGVMGETVAAAVLAAGWDAGLVTVAEPRAERRAELTGTHGFAGVATEVRDHSADRLVRRVRDAAAGGRRDDGGGAALSRGWCV